LSTGGRVVSDDAAAFFGLWNCCLARRLPRRHWQDVRTLHILSGATSNSTPARAAWRVWCEGRSRRYQDSEDRGVRDILAFAGALYGASVGGTAVVAVFAGSNFGLPLRFGLWGTGGLALMGMGVAAYSFIKFAQDTH
jgi:hypothetical protein